MEQSPVSSPTRKERNSSIELYRITATFTVLIIHFNGWFVRGMPEKLNLDNPSTFRIGQAIIDSAFCICINIFLLISVFFGIQLKGRSILKICLLLLLIYITSDFLNPYLKGNIRLSSFTDGVFVMSRSGYFVQCYMLLIFLSPVLNDFVEKYGKSILPWTISLVLIETWFGNIKSIDCLGFGRGYHCMHFVLMYMVARCLYLYKDVLLSLKMGYWIIGYLLCTLFILIQYIIGIRWTFDYSNPICIIFAICSFMPFVYFNYYSSVINWIASSTFAVYIIQVPLPIL